jgi:WD40 repeat protein
VHEFHKVENGTIGDSKGTVSLASGKQTALLASESSVHLWDLERNACFLQTNFSKLDSQSEKALYAASINPDGNSLICAFEDKVKIYKILLTKLRFIAEFSIKKCNQLLYSHGGQYVACKYGKGANSSVTILNTLRMTEITTLKTHAEPTFMLWNEMDDELIIATDNNTITGYKLAESVKSFTVKIQEHINMVRIDYTTKSLLVSTDKCIYVVDKDKVEKTIEPKVPKFNFIYPLHGYYFVASKDGNLYWSSSLSFDSFMEMPIFINQPFNLLYRNGYMLAYSSFENITIVECLRQNLPAKKQLLKTSEDIVFV